MDSKLVSVVIPIYNVEKYLDRCLRSVTEQTYRNLEILLIDDGSPDNCPAMCEEWAGKDSRIKVIHKQNAGLGMARNTGIDHAMGDYICFFDSDDYVASDLVEKTLSLAEKNQADVVVYGFQKVFRNGSLGPSVIPHTPKLVYADMEVTEEFLPDLIGPNTATGEKTDLWISACGALFSMKPITNAQWRFVSERDIISEDIYSLLELYAYVKRVSVLSEALYFYCENTTSLTHVYRPDRFEKNKHFYNACVELCDRMGYGLAVKERVSYPYISNAIGAMKMIVVSKETMKKKLDNLCYIMNDSHFHGLIASIAHQKEEKKRRILLKCIAKRWYWQVYLLIKMKSFF